MRMKAAKAIVFAALAARPGGLLAKESVWPLTKEFEVRYETHHNITPEELASGRTPAFDVRLEKAGDAVVMAITDEPKGRRTGYIYVGRRIRLPSRAPMQVRVRLAYKRECSARERAPRLILRVCTAEGWDKLCTSPEKPPPRGTWGRGVILQSCVIAAGRDDTLKWTDWVSPNLSPSLRRCAGRTVVVALGMAAMHTSSREWARFRSPEVVMSDTPPKAPARELKYPPKTRRTLLSDEQIALARRRCKESPEAARLRDALVHSLQSWLKRSDEEIRALIPPAAVPRAFNVSTRGCPVHGKKIYRYGTYPWRLDLNKPFKIICPVGGEEYPSNDFFAYLKSGFKDRSLLKGKYVDDGWGWKSPDGELYWLVGYACHWHWRRFILPTTLRLSEAYVLTGDPRYARKCAVMLDRIADVYPSMNYAEQSRYGYETGGRYRGKILNHIWETGTVRWLAAAYDNIFDALKDGGPLEGKLAKSCKATRANIEANLLEEAIERVKDGTISGNFGMHQCALAIADIVRQNGPVKEDLDWMLRQSGKHSGSHEGVEYAFYNFIYKDGMPFETSPGYCFSWLANFVSLAKVLNKAGYDFYRLPKFKAMFEAFLDLVCVGKFTPAIGDAGSVTSGVIGRSIPVYAAAFEHYRDPRFAHALDAFGAFRRRRRFVNIASLFEPDVLEEAKAAAAKTPARRPRSRVLDGYGLGVLNNANDSVAVSIYYGYKGGHGHFDRLNFSLFAHGCKMTPDLGYPDFMNALVPGIFSWSKNTVSHNCVVVNKHRQTGNVPGRVEAFLDSDSVRFIDISAKGTYPEASQYRRALLLVDLGPNDAYLADFFTVEGGEQHDYSIHGPLGAFDMENGRLSAPRKGTLAGPDVAYGQLYDDPKLGAPNYRGGYSGYKGSGFQHLERVQTLAGRKWWARWRLEGAKDVGLRLRILPQPGQQVFVCDGRVSPTGKRPWVLKYLIARRKGKALRSRYIALLEPFKGEPQILDAERIDIESGFALRVRRKRGEDLIVYQPTPRPVEVAGLRTDAALCVARWNEAGELNSLTMLNGTTARWRGRELSSPPAMQGRVTAVDYKNRVAVVTPARGAALPTDDTLRDRPVIFSNKLHSCFYTIRSVEKRGDAYAITFNEPTLITGRAQVNRVQEKEKRILTGSMFAFRGIYPGMRAVNEARTVSLRVAAVERGFIQLLDAPRAADFTDANLDGVADAWLYDFGPGDAFRIDSAVVLGGE